MESDLEQVGQMLASPTCSHVLPLLLAHAEHSEHPLSSQTLHFDLLCPCQNDHPQVSQQSP